MTEKTTPLPPPTGPPEEPAPVAEPLAPPTGAPVEPPPAPPPPSGIRALAARLRRTNPILLAGGLAAVAGVVIVLAIVLGGGDGGRPSVTSDQFSQVDLGDSKEHAADVLGGPGEADTYTNSSGASSTTFDDCWLYDTSGSGFTPDGSPASRSGGSSGIKTVRVCFENDQVALKGWSVGEE